MKIINQEITNVFAAYHGDSCEAIKAIPDNSLDYIVYSPPFESLYTYSASERDMGNSADSSEFHEHYAFLVGEMFRALKPGRLLSWESLVLQLAEVAMNGNQDAREELVRMAKIADSTKILAEALKRIEEIKGSSSGPKHALTECNYIAKNALDRLAASTSRAKTFVISWFMIFMRRFFRLFLHCAS